MPVIPSTVLQRIATLPIAIHEADEIVFAAGTTTGRLLILMKGAVTIEKEGTEIAKVTEPGGFRQQVMRTLWASGAPLGAIKRI